MYDGYDPSTSRRLANNLFITQSFFSASQIAIFTLVSIVAVKLSGTEATAGMPSTTMTLVQAISAYPLGMIMGRWGRRLGLTIGYSLSVFGAALGVMAIISESFPALLISAALMGAGRAGADLSRFIAGDLFPPQMRARMIGRIVFAGTIGAIVGPLLVAPSTHLAGQVGLPEDTGPWAVGFLFYSAACLLTFIRLRPDPQIIAQAISKEYQPQRQTVGPGRSIRALLRLPSVQLAILGMLISQTVMVVLMVITPLHMYHHNHDNAAVSLVLSAHTLGMFGLASVTGHLIDRFGRIEMLVAGALVLILSAIISPLSTHVLVLIIGLFLLGLGWSFGYIAGSTLLADSLSGEERTRMQGINDMLVAFCAALGSLSSGPLFAGGGYSAVSMLGIVLVVLLLWLVRLLNPGYSSQLMPAD